MTWVSVRNKWPEEKGIYKVKDCRHEVFGKAFYDGYEWHEPEMEVPKTGSLLLTFYTITHWMKEDDLG